MCEIMTKKIRHSIATPYIIQLIDTTLILQAVRNQFRDISMPSFLPVELRFERGSEGVVC